MRRAIVAGLAVIAAVTLTGCADKNVDVKVTGATKVPGVGNLFRFCDGNTLIYFSQYSGTADEYEFIVYDGCKPADQVPPQHGVQSAPDDKEK